MFHTDSGQLTSMAISLLLDVKTKAQVSEMYTYQQKRYESARKSLLHCLLCSPLFLID